MGKNWIEEQLKNKAPFERIISASYRAGVGLYNDWIYGSDIYSWKDLNNQIWHQFRRNEPTIDYSIAYLQMKCEEAEIPKGTIYD